jgi:hypothetical protein
MNGWPRKEKGEMANPKDMSPEAGMRELAEILAGGFLRVRRRGANSSGNVHEIEGEVSVTDNTTNGCN